MGGGRAQAVVPAQRVPGAEGESARYPPRCRVEGLHQHPPPTHPGPPCPALDTGAVNRAEASGCCVSEAMWGLGAGRPFFPAWGSGAGLGWALSRLLAACLVALWQAACQPGGPALGARQLSRKVPGLGSGNRCRNVVCASGHMRWGGVQPSAAACGVGRASGGLRLRPLWPWCPWPPKSSDGLPAFFLGAVLSLEKGVPGSLSRVAWARWAPTALPASGSPLRALDWDPLSLALAT